jgi:hypothetical protein
MAPPQTGHRLGSKVALGQLRRASPKAVRWPSSDNPYANHQLAVLRTGCDLNERLDAHARSGSREHRTVRNFGSSETAKQSTCHALLIRACCWICGEGASWLGKGPRETCGLEFGSPGCRPSRGAGAGRHHANSARHLNGLGLACAWLCRFSIAPLNHGEPMDRDVLSTASDHQARTCDYLGGPAVGNLRKLGIRRDPGAHGPVCIATSFRRSPCYRRSPKSSCCGFLTLW